jgi:tetratricopeptide (TPR) repeat protein
MPEPATLRFMSLPRTLLLATAAFLPLGASLRAAPDVAKLRDQLALATTDADTLSRIELLRRILDAEPVDTKSHQLLIELWLKIQDYDMAEATLKAWPDAPPAVAALTTAQVLRYRDRDIPGAIRVLREYLAKSPKDLDAHHALVSALLTTNDAKAQIAALDALILLERDETSYIQRANAKLADGDYTGAIADAKTAQSINADANIVKSNLPQFERLGETLKALPPLDAAITANPHDYAKLLDRSWWLRYGGLNARALADANAALALEPDSLMAKLARARTGYLLDQIKADDVKRDDLIDVSKPHALETSEAIAACDLALASDPKNVTQLSARAAALNDAEQYLLARRDADTALAIDPKAADAALAGIYASVMLGDDTTAATLLRQVESMKPNKAKFSQALGDLSDLYLQKSNLPIALDLADKSIALKPTEHAWRVKAAALQRMGRTKEAQAAFARADKLKQP